MGQHKSEKQDRNLNVTTKQQYLLDVSTTPNMPLSPGQQKLLNMLTRVMTASAILWAVTTELVNEVQGYRRMRSRSNNDTP